MEKMLSRGMLAIYTILLVWLVLFKLSFHISGVLDFHFRSLNLTPFAAPARVNGAVNYGEMVLNCIFFVPFGLLLNVNFKQYGFLPKLVCILVFSLAAEAIQYVLAIGATDITDVIMNTAGGLAGLVLYAVSNRFIKTEILDRIIISLGMLLLILFLYLRVGHIVIRYLR